MHVTPTICTTDPGITRPFFSTWHWALPYLICLYLRGFNLKYDFRGRRAYVHSFNKVRAKINGAVPSLFRKDIES
jgi:hypothetical protein